MVALEDIGGESCEPVSGFSDVVYYALHSDFETINDPKKICDPTPANVAANYAELSTIATAHVFKTGKCFKKIEAITESGNIKSPQIGDPGRGLFQNDYGLEIAGSDPSTLGFCRFIKNQKLVILVEEFGTGNVRQLGSSKFPARAKAEHNVEGAAEAKNSALITFTDKNFGPAPIYNGTIQLAPTPAP